MYQYFSATVFIYANMWNVDGKKPESSQITESGKTWMRMGYLFRIFHFHHFPANVRKLLHLFEKKKSPLNVRILLHLPEIACKCNNFQR